MSPALGPGAESGFQADLEAQELGPCPSPGTGGDAGWPWLGRLSGEQMPLSEASWRLGPSQGPQLRRAGGLSRATWAGNRRQSPWVPGPWPCRDAYGEGEGLPSPQASATAAEFHLGHKHLHRPGTGAAARRKTSHRKSPECSGASQPQGRPRDLASVLGRNSVVRFHGQTLGYRNVNEPLKPVLSLPSVASRAPAVWRARHADCAPRSPPWVRLGAPAPPPAGAVRV